MGFFETGCTHCCHVYLLFPSLSVTGPLRSSVQAELQQQEDLLYRERKERERIIAGYRRKVEEHKARAEKVDRRVRMIAYLLSSCPVRYFVTPRQWVNR